MTILVTEVSRSGIVMCADSRLSRLDQKRGTISVYTDTQRKIERFDGVGVSYWGFVSNLVQTGKDINLWIKRVLEKKPRSSTPSDVAHALAKHARQCWGAKARPVNECVGFHVAGYEPWKEGGPLQPVIYHVHNGHGHFVESENRDGTLRVEWISTAPGSEIQVNRDFPDGASQNCEMAPDDLLDLGWPLRNGDFYITAKVLDAYLEALRRIAAVDHYRKAPLALPAREALLRRAVELAVRTQKEFTQPGGHVTVGGKIISEALRWPNAKV